MSELKHNLQHLVLLQPNAFDFLQDDAPDGCWYYHASHPEKLWINPRFKACLGYTADKELSWDEIKSHAEAGLEDFVAHLKSQPEGINYRLQRQNGSYIWFRVRMLPDNQDKDGLLIGFKTIRMTDALGVAYSKPAVMNLLNEYEGDSIIITDTEGYTVWINKGCEQLTGYTLNEMRGRKPGELLQGAATDPNTVRQVGQAVRNKKPIRTEIVNYHKNGKAYWLELNLSPIFDEQGNCTGFMSVGRDITHRKAKESEAHFQAQLLAKVGQPIIATDTEGHIFYWNKKAEEVYGWASDEVIGKKIMDIVPLKDISPEERLTIQRQNFGKLWSQEFVAQRRNGELFHVQITNQPILNERGEPVALVGISQDITERKRYEEELQKQAKLQNTLMRLSTRFINLPIEQLSDALDEALTEIGSLFHTDRAYIFEYDFDKKIAINTHEWCNEGVEPQKDNLQAVPLDDIPEWVEAHLKGEYIHISNVDQLEEGALKTLLQMQQIKSLLTIPVCNGNRCLGFVGFDAVKQLHDFDESERSILTVFTELLVNVWLRRQTERELRRTQQLLEQTNRVARIGGWEIDFVASTLYWSDITKAIHEITDKDLPHTFFDLNEQLEQRISFYKEGYSKNRIREVITRAIREGTPFDEELQIVTAKGRELWVRVIGEAQMENGRCQKLYGSFYDIDAAKRTELALRRKTEEFDELVALIPLGVYKYEYQEGHRFAYVSPVFCKMNNLDAQEIYCNPQLIIDLIHPEDRAYFLRANEEAVSNKTDFMIEVRLIINNQVRWMRVAARAKTDENGYTTWFGTQADVTEEKLAALALAQAKEKAEAASRAKSEFLANMSHEIRTPLNGIIGFVELLTDTPLNTLQKEYMESVRQSARALQALINDILDFSKIEAGKLELYPEPVVIADLIRQTAQTVSYQVLEKKLNLLVDVAPNIPVVQADSSKLRQVLINLLGNAVKFTEKGMISVKVQLKDLSEGHAILRFSVRDTGIGIAPEHQQKIFEAFVQADAYTTKRFGGTGLGLSISNSLLRLMGSRLQLESEPGRGSHFYFELSLPLAVQQPAPVTAVAQAPDGKRLQATAFTVLLVDDNPINLLLERRMIQNIASQARIREAANGKAAIEAYTTEAPDIILMDLQMPEMNGMEATRRIRALEQANGRYTPIVAVTAGAINEEQEACLAAGMDDFMAKPITQEGLSDMLSKWIVDRSVTNSVARQPKKCEETKEDFDTILLDYVRNDAETARQIKQLTLERFAYIGEQLAQSISSRNLQQLQKTGHDLRGSALNLGLTKLADLGLELEQLTQWEDDVIRQRSEELKTSIGHLQAWMSRHLPD